MRRIIRMFFRTDDPPPPPRWNLSSEQHRHLLELLSEIGLGIVSAARGPVPLLTFGRCVLERLGPRRMALIPLPEFADALKRVIREMQHDRLRVMSPSDFPGVGYVYNATDPDTWPVRTSR
jgi:LmbE family N-acetylglucosaminyl deacetylase